MKKNITIISMILVVVLSLVFMFTACGNAKTNNGVETNTQNGNTQNTNPGTGNGDNTQNGNNQSSGSTLLTGEINVIDLDDRDASVLRGVRIIGNCVGTKDDINGKESSLTDVRCIFELNEWIEFYPDTDATYGLRVWILKHRDDQEYYQTCTFSDLMPNFAQYCILRYPEDEEDPDTYPWGSFYLHQQECETGYYDFVFTYEGKAIGVLLTRFYASEGELNNKSGAELEALMHN